MLNYVFDNHVVTLNQPVLHCMMRISYQEYRGILKHFYYQNDVLGCDKPIDHIRERKDGTGEIFQNKQHILYLFNFMESHNFLKNPHSHQLWSWSSQKKEKLPYPRCGLGAYLRCG